MSGLLSLPVTLAPAATLRDTWAALRGHGPVSLSRFWPRDLAQAFPERRRREAWAGEGASFARYDTAGGAVFLKYLPAGERQPRYFRRFKREITYLRDLAPLVDVPHAPLLHWATDPARRRAHLLTWDLTDTTYGWGHFQSDLEREKGLHDVARLLAHLHTAWAGHPALTGRWTWDARAAAQAGEALAQGYQGPQREAVREAGKQLGHLLTQAPLWTIVHGDIHSGQVLWPRAGLAPTLIDYGQTHAGIPGEDLAHLLAVRLRAEERARYGPGIRDAYARAWAERGLAPLTAAQMRAQERAGAALNLLSTAQQCLERQSEGGAEALENVAVAWAEQAE